MSAPRPCRPADMSELAALMAGPGPVHPVAGATDLLIDGRALPEGGVLVDLTALPELRGIETGAADIRIGAATTVAALETHAGLAERFAALAQAAAACGAVQIRNRATIGGNIANAAPSADLVVALTLARARLSVIAPGGHAREIALGDHRPDAGLLITAVVVPGAGLRPASAFVSSIDSAATWNSTVSKPHAPRLSITPACASASGLLVHNDRLMPTSIGPSSRLVSESRGSYPMGPLATRSRPRYAWAR